MKKRFLAWLSALTIFLSIFGTVMPALTTDALSDWTLLNNATVSGDNNDGYTVAVPFASMTYKFASRQGVGDFTAENLEFNTPEIANSAEDATAEDSQEWIQLSLTAETISSIDDMRGATIKPGLHLRFIRYRAADPDRIVIRLYDGAKESNICSFEYDLTKTHSLSFVEEDGKWYLSFDDVVQKGTDLTSYLSGLKGKTVYYTLTSASAVAQVTGLKFVAPPQTLPEGWTAINGASVVGDTVEGYTLQVPGSGSEHRFASWLTAGDFSEKDLTFMTPQIANSAEDATAEDINEWIQLSITAEPITSFDDVQGDTIKSGLHLRFHRWRESDPDRIVVKLFNGITENNVCSFTYDLSQAHTMGFVKRGGKWYLSFDDVVYTENGGNDLDLTSYLSALEGGDVYYTFTSASKVAQISSLNTVEPKPQPPEGWTEYLGDVTLTEGEGYTITGGFDQNPSCPYEWVTYETTQDFSENDISFKMTLDPEKMDQDEWGYISVTSEPISVYTDILGTKNNGLRILLLRQLKTRLTIQLWDPATKSAITILPTIYNFDFEGTHRLGFVKEDGKWYMRFDNIIYNAESGGLDLTPYLGSLEGKPTYYQFSGHAAYTYEKVQFLDSSIQPVLPPFNYTGFTIEGDDETGYSLEGIGNAVYKNAIDIDTQAVSMCFTPNKLDNWVYLGFSSSPTWLKRLLTVEEQEKYPTIELILTRQVTGALHLSIWNPETKLAEAVGAITDFDWSATHTFALYCDEDGYYYLMVDGYLQYGFDMTEMVESLAGKKLYPKLASGSGEGVAASISGFKLVDMPLMIVEEYPDEEEGFNDWVENPDWGDGDYEENVDLNTPGDEYTDDAWSDNFFENAVNTDDTETSDDDANESTPTQEEATQKTTRRRVQVIKRIKQDGLSPWIWVGIAGGAVLVAGGATLLFLYYKKKHGKKTATGNKVEGE